VLLISLLTEQHVLVFGGAGGAKTQTATDVMSAMDGKLFSHQFTTATKQDHMIGSVKGEQLIKNGVREYELKQSLLKHPYAILDEIDKANPDVLASALSVLLERKAMLGHEE
jgi:MoxR-like ATPase